MSHIKGQAGRGGRTGAIGFIASGTLAGSAILFLPIAVFSLIAWQTFGSAPQGTVTHFLVITVAVLGFSVFTGNTGIVSFGHAAFMGLSAHITGALTIPVAQKAIFLPACLPSWPAWRCISCSPA